ATLRAAGGEGPGRRKRHASPTLHHAGRKEVRVDFPDPAVRHAELLGVNGANGARIGAARQLIFGNGYQTGCPSKTAPALKSESFRRYGLGSHFAAICLITS